MKYIKLLLALSLRVEIFPRALRTIAMLASVAFALGQISLAFPNAAVYVNIFGFAGIAFILAYLLSLPFKDVDIPFSLFTDMIESDVKCVTIIDANGKGGFSVQQEAPIPEAPKTSRSSLRLQSRKDAETFPVNGSASDVVPISTGTAS